MFVISVDYQLFSHAIGMGGRISWLLSSSSRQSTFDKKVVEEVPPVHDRGRPFVEMLKDHPHYGEWSNEKIVYDISLVHCQLHWYLLVKKANSMRLPFITLEIRTNNLISLVPWLDTHSYTTLSSISATYVGTYVGTLHSLVQMADDVVTEMRNYDLLTSNCQVFCNKMLKRMGKPEFETTYRTGMIDDTFDKIIEDLSTDESEATRLGAIGRQVAPMCIAVSKGDELNTNENKLGATAKKIPCSTVTEKTVCDNASVPKHELKKAVPTLSVSDLDVLHKILIPIKDDWMGIGCKLHLQPDILQRIKDVYRKPEGCLREMLRNYLEQRIPLPLWEELVQAAEQYNLAVANSITRRAESISEYNV